MLPKKTLADETVQKEDLADFILRYASLQATYVLIRGIAKWCDSGLVCSVK